MLTITSTDFGFVHMIVISLVGAAYRHYSEVLLPV